MSAAIRARRLAFLLVLLVAGLASGPASAQGPRGPAVVSEVRIEGNARVDQHAIRVHVATEPGQTLEGGRLDADLRSVYGMGFFDDVVVSVDEDPKKAGAAIVTFRVKERPLVRDVKIDGESEVKQEELEDALGVRARTIYDPEKVRRGIVQARGLFEKEGYLDVKIEPEVVPTDKPDEIDIVYKLEQGEPIRIGEIEFEGNDNFSSGQLRSVMVTKEKWFLSWLFGSGTLNREELKTDTDRITAFYYDHGYVNVKVEKPEVERQEDALVIKIKVVEGEPYDFGTIQFAGDFVDGDVADEKLREEIKAQQGETFRSSTLREDVEHLTDFYGDRGYAFANVEPETLVNPEKKAVDVTFRVSKGEPVRIGAIEITGNTKTRDKVIRREMKVQEQEPFSATALRRSRDSLQRLGFFSEVNVTTRKSPVSDQINVLVDVKEGSTGAFSAGAGFSSGDQFLFNVRVSENNLWGYGIRAVANADFGSVRRNIYLSLTDPYLLDTQIMGAVTLYSAALEFPDFTREANGVSLRALYPFEAIGIDHIGPITMEDTRFGLEYRIEQARIFDVAANAPPSIFDAAGSTLISSISPGILRNTLNHAFDPTDGSYQDIAFEMAGLGGDKFYRFEGRGRWFYPAYDIPAFGPLVLSTGGTIAYGRGEEGLSGRELPLIERYFPGGISTIRGFETRSLGPRENTISPQGVVVNNQAVGGSNELVLQNEFIFPIYQQIGLRGVLFFDLGNAWFNKQGIDLGDLRYSFGAGLRWLSPFGPLRIEFGIPLNAKRDEPEQPIQFSFGAPL